MYSERSSESYSTIKAPYEQPNTQDVEELITQCQSNINKGAEIDSDVCKRTCQRMFVIDFPQRFKYLPATRAKKNGVFDVHQIAKLHRNKEVY